MEKLLVSSRLQGNLGLVSFAQLLPLFGTPWPALGSREILTRIGKLLDSITTDGTDNPQWDAAVVTADTHWLFASGTAVSGSILAAPVFRPRHYKWGFEVELRLDQAEVNIRIYIGPEDNAKVRRIMVHCDDPFTKFAGELQAIGVSFERYLQER